MHQHQKAFVLFSGGVDSTTALFLALEQHDSNPDAVKAFSMDYGQRHVREAEAAKAICAKLGIEHRIINIQGALGNSMLTDPSIEVPDISYHEIQGVSPTYVPFRNGFMLSRITAEAQLYVNSVNEQIQGTTPPAGYLEDLVTIYFGAHAEDAFNWAYPDCTPEFVGAMANAIYIGTYKAVRLATPFNYMSKAHIIEWGARMGVPYEMTWSCYKGEELHCGTCPTCRARKEAFASAGVEDYTRYAA
jgi:7-cyano-7-deazaguanine synthase